MSALPMTQPYTGGTFAGSNNPNAKYNSGPMNEQYVNRNGQLSSSTGPVWSGYNFGWPGGNPFGGQQGANGYGAMANMFKSGLGAGGYNAQTAPFGMPTFNQGGSYAPAWQNAQKQRDSYIQGSLNSANAGNTVPANNNQAGIPSWLQGILNGQGQPAAQTGNAVVKKDVGVIAPSNGNSAFPNIGDQTASTDNNSSFMGTANNLYGPLGGFLTNPLTSVLAGVAAAVLPGKVGQALGQGILQGQSAATQGAQTAQAEQENKRQQAQGLGTINQLLAMNPTWYQGMADQTQAGYQGAAQTQQQGFDQANQNVMGAYNGVTAGTQGLLQNLGQQELQNIRSDYGNQGTKDQAALAARGLGNSTAVTNAAASNQRQMQMALNQKQQTIDQTRAGMLAQTGGAAANAAQNMQMANYGDQNNLAQAYLQSQLALNQGQYNSMMGLYNQGQNILTGTTYNYPTLDYTSGAQNTLASDRSYDLQRRQLALQQQQANQGLFGNMFGSALGAGANMYGANAMANAYKTVNGY